MEPTPSRRNVLRWATIGLGILFSVLLAIPFFRYLIDPLNRKSRQSSFRPVDGVRLDDERLARNEPVQGVIRDVRVDGWTLHPSDVLGRVWVVKDPSAEGGHRVFTTICPHLGCSVNHEGSGFACPCHGAQFRFDGTRTGGPAPRDMDSLEWQRDETDPARVRILVRYQAFEGGVAEKKPIGS
jgi:Rieske Fe-S protein